MSAPNDSVSDISVPDASARAIDLSIYLVTDEALCGERGVVQTAIDAVAGGATTVQLRHKNASDEQLLETLLQLAHAISDRATLLVNDRVDVFTRAKALGAAVHGVHVGQGDLDPRAVRALIGEDAILGLSADSAAHLAAVRALPAGTADYLGVGAVRATSTKPDHPPVLGIDGFAAVTAQAALPCVAIGGIGLADAQPLRRVGAAGIAVVSAICAATDAREAAAQLREEWSA
ncbi:thiamine-phosphate diphosphorylase [Leucobacter exalbidus]|uniref:Thiamine-phosphate synthase n=1 Tax=Leucobacter exalbidus TaxID=662960 RepID=A0A940PR09_9MICO|nr:thiamine phosphate synthase [Leucobacter exalbidus]MBP1325017.1 thiamine-phosphate diphosphorylase [Leucobacter exalbidus]